MEGTEQVPFHKKAKRMGLLCRLRLGNPRRLDRIEMAGHGEILAPMLLNIDWNTLSGAYVVESVVPIEEYYVNETRGFVPTYEEYKEAIARAVVDMNDYKPLVNGNSLIYLDSAGGWHARACTFVAESANLPVITIETNPDVKLAVIETIRHEPEAGKP